MNYTYRSRLKLLGFITLVLLLVISAVYVYRAPKLPSTLWLPTNPKQTNDQWEVINLPVESSVVSTRYGRALRVTSPERWHDIYHLKPNALLKASACPNMANYEELSPSACRKLGTINGADVYTIHRALPSGAIEYFMEQDGTFVMARLGGDGGANIDYIRSFTPMNRAAAARQLRMNAERVKTVQAKIAADKAAEERKSKAAYTKLAYTPALPQTLPEGWKRDGKFDIDGPDAEHPKMVTANYVKAKGQYITVYVMHHADAMLGSTCGPTPGQGMNNLNCYQAPNYSGMYESIISGTNGDLFRYVYYPVGESVVISRAAAYSQDGKPVAWPEQLFTDQDVLTHSAQPVSKTSLKDSQFFKTFYQ